MHVRIAVRWAELHSSWIAFLRVGTAAPKLGWALSEMFFRAESTNGVVYAIFTRNQTTALRFPRFAKFDQSGLAFVVQRVRNTLQMRKL